MTAVARPRTNNSRGGGSGAQKSLLAVIFVILFVLIVYLAVPSDDPNNNSQEHNILAQLPQEAGRLRMSVEKKRQQLRAALAESLGTHVSQHLPERLRLARDKHEIIGERLVDIKAGTETVEEVLHGDKPANVLAEMNSDKPPMSLEEIIEYLTSWIHLLHDTLGNYKNANYEGIWQGYHDLTVKTLYPWDREYLSRMPPRRHDGSIFLSVATYRDENCLNTLTQAYQKAANPEKLFVGLVQQNCEHDCMSGVLEGGKIAPVEPDQDCHRVFCAQHPERCDQIRPLHINEPESLGP